MIQRTLRRLIFDGGFSEQDEAEATLRGYRSHVWVELSDGSRHPVTFYDVTRLSQTLKDDCAAGRPFFSERGLVILPMVTLANMENAARVLSSEGYFEIPGTP
jgi:hypothetical protein